jgi:hypothetical protein
MQQILNLFKNTADHVLSWDIPTASDTKQKPNVVIVGAGFAGASVAMMLQSEAHVTLISKNPYFENTCAMHRIVVDPQLLSQNRLSPSEVQRIITN